MNFLEFLNAMGVKPQTTLAQRQRKKEKNIGFKVSQDMTKPVPKKMKSSMHPSSTSPVSATLRKQRLTSPKNRFKIRKGSSLDTNLPN